MSKRCSYRQPDSNDPNEEVMSLATYSNRESVILTYISIFETLWTQTELTQSNKRVESKMQLALSFCSFQYNVYVSKQLDDI